VIDSQISHPPALIGPDEQGAVDFCKTNNMLQVRWSYKLRFFFSFLKPLCLCYSVRL